MKTLIACTAAVILCGCSLISPKIDQQLQSVAQKYCQQPIETRQVLRQTVNQAIAPAEACIWCPTDPLPKCIPPASP